MKREKSADQTSIGDLCTFTRQFNSKADAIVSVDSFEHFDDPGQILDTMADMLVPNGVVWISFRPPWYHPHGGHLFSVFPWAHLIFTEIALIRWRSDFKTDQAKRFGEVEGGLNQMTIKRFKQLIDSSQFRFDFLEKKPIRRLRFFSNPITREFVTSIVRCRLILR
jgi:SAM-dependent methyltransferase